MVLLMSCVGTGCISSQPTPVNPLPQRQVVETVETDADRLLNYYAYMTSLQGDNLLQEYQRVQDEYHADPSDFHRMQLIMLLSSPRASFRDTELARLLLKGWLEKEYNTYSKLYPLALLYDTYLAELSNRNKAISQADSQLRETGSRLRETNEQAEQQGEQIARQKSELAQERQRSAELQQKLDALLEMEKALIEREQP